MQDTAERAGIEERYSTAVNSSTLVVNPRTSMSATDILGAMGIADRELTEGKTSQGDPVRPAPLAVSLERLLRGGDARVAHSVVRGMADLVWREARGKKVKLTHADARDMAKVVLAWFRHGTCKPCGGHGFALIKGSKTHSDARCEHCKGAGKRSLAKEFEASKRDLADWLRNEVEREAGRAGPRAMAHLAFNMDL
jgi:hypothetical protein